MDGEVNKREMGLTVDIDAGSGFCYGVIRAINHAEEFLSENDTLLSLGSIVHNRVEIERLAEQGLKVINSDELSTIKNTSVLFRAHGEPPVSYLVAKENNLSIIDCTCPVVLRLQKKVRDAYNSLKGTNGTIVIFGKRGHAEVNGLIGQVDGDALIIQDEDDLKLLDVRNPVIMFSQTTMEPQKYAFIIKRIKEKIAASGAEDSSFKAYNTICNQVASRHPHLKEFSLNHDIIIFVSGKESSNGKALYEVCKGVNNRSYKIENSSDIYPAWFNQGDRVGICGATSTPKWLLEEVAQFVKSL